MEWVETTGRTIEEAKEAALDQLGVDEGDAEFEILAEPKRGLFGIGGTEARVRARVRPATPRPKDERRRRRDRGERGERGGDRPRGRRQDSPRPDGRGAREADRDEDRPKQQQPDTTDKGAPVDDDVPVTEQAEMARAFVAGLVEAFGASATVTAAVEDDTIEVAVTGEDLGLLIGPKGQTLQAVQELAKTVVQRHVPGRVARLHVDVAGYREKRREALARFTHQVAEQVVATGERRALEPMNPADRKVVHDTANTIDGVTTTSEGEEPRRRVVILPADPGA